MKEPSALLLGAYGQTNLGDDLLLYDYLKLLVERGFTKITINASVAKFIPQVILDEFPLASIEIFETYNTSPLELFKRMLKTDVIVYGGGTVFKELYATTGRKPYAVIANVAAFNTAARLLGKKVYGFHLGIGTIKTRLGRWFSRRAIMASTKTTFRDEASYDYAKNVLKLPENKIELSTDGLFTNRDWQKPWHTLQLPKTITARKNGKLVGVNVLSDIPDWVDRKKYVKNLCDFIDALIERGDYVVLLPFQYDFNKHSDLYFMEHEIVPKLKHKKGYYIAKDLALDNIISALQQVDVLVGLRFHSLLLATVANTPFVALAYDTKCWRYTTEINYPYALKIEEFDAEQLMEQYEKVCKDSAKIKAKLTREADKNFKAGDVWLKNSTL
ncbi:MAG TPA: polysaccharide pyruvyl transferase family protein [Candidatus Saccharimonadales bacterium]|nr:polysaccharide pyruvyl transferase family protein [Candidatus Saccharimonadales bacterium]